MRRARQQYKDIQHKNRTYLHTFETGKYHYSVHVQ